MKYKLNNILVYTNLLVVLSSVLFLSSAFSLYIYNLQYENYGQSFLRLADAISKQDDVIEMAKSAKSDPDVFRYIQSITEETGYYIAIATSDYIRLTHFEEDKIGTVAQTEHEERIALGEDFFAFDSEGAMGSGLKAFAFIEDETDNMIGHVVVSFEKNIFNDVITQCIILIMLGSLVSLFISLPFSLYIAKKIRSLLLDYEPEDIVRITKERVAIVDSINEGILFFDKNKKLTLINDSAKQMLQLDKLENDLEVELFNKLTLINDSAKQMLQLDKLENDLEVELFNVFSSSNEEYADYMVARFAGKEFFVDRNDIYNESAKDTEWFGVAFTLRPKDATYLFAEELTGVKNYMSALRAQVHEFRNTIHAVHGLIFDKNYDALEDYVKDIIEVKYIETFSPVAQIKDSILSAFLSSKHSHAKERNIDFEIDVKNTVPVIKDNALLHDVITIIGNLLDNSFESFSDSNSRYVKLEVSHLVDDNILKIAVADNGDGISFEDQNDIFKKGVTTKGSNHGTGLYLVKRAITKRNGFTNVYSSDAGTTIIVHIKLDIQKGEEL